MKSVLSKLSILAASLILAAGCAATRTDRSTGERVDDATVTSKVKLALTKNSTTKARDIEVTTFRGTVQLNGFVDSSDMKSAATRVATGVRGVVSVDNNLRIGDERTAGEYIDDKVLGVKVRTALVQDPIVKERQITVETHEGVVQLGGFVNSSDEKAQATRVASAVTGVRSVKNDLTVKE
jgi:hyperosmotically inducible periplasmic protein